MYTVVHSIFWTKTGLINTPFEMDRKSQYIICPLPLIKDLLADGETMAYILDCGIFYRAMNQDVTLQDAKNALIRCYVNERNAITSNLLLCCEHGFENHSFAKFDPSASDYPQEQKLLDKGLKSLYGITDPMELTIWYKCYLMLRKFNLDRNFTPNLIQLSKKWFHDNGVCRLKGEPTFLCNFGTIFKLCKERGQLSESRRALWTMYFAIMSILGTKDYASTTSETIMTRMAGAKNQKQLQITLDSMTGEQRDLYAKYTTRRRYDRLLSNLQTSKMIVEFGYARRTYVSAKLDLKTLCTSVLLQADIIRRMKKQKFKVLAKAKAEIREMYKLGDECI